MSLQVERMDVWVGGVNDMPGALASELAALSESGANLEFVLARRAPDNPGTGVVFAGPIVGTSQARAARSAGFHKSHSLIALRVQGRDRKGLGADIMAAIAMKGVNVRGMSANVIGRKFVANLAFDSKADATRAARVLRSM